MGQRMAGHGKDAAELRRYKGCDDSAEDCGDPRRTGEEA